jgi:hypothetical protein
VGEEDIQVQAEGDPGNIDDEYDQQDQRKNDVG